MGKVAVIQDRGLPRVRLPSRRQWVRVGLVALTLAAYCVSFRSLCARFGSAAFLLDTVPVVVAAATLGVPFSLGTILILVFVDRHFAVELLPTSGLGPWAGALSATSNTVFAVGVAGLRALILRLRSASRELEQHIAARHAVAETLRHNLELHRSLVNSMGEGVGLFDREDRFVFANQAAERILDAAPTGLLGVSLPNLLSEEGRQGLLSNRNRSLPGPVSYDVTLNRDPVRILLVTETRFEHETSGGTRTLRVFRDVSERARLEREQRKLELQVERAQALQSLAVLAGGVAHDFNNLLAGVLGNAELAMLKLPTECPSAVRACLEEIRRFAKEAADLSKQMLAYAGRRGLCLERVNLNQVIEDVVHLLNSVIASRTTLKLELAPALPDVQADRVQLRQVVMNLTMNAVESMANGGGLLVLRTSLDELTPDTFPARPGSAELRPGRYVVLSVEDSGAGMSPATMIRIFEPFFSTKVTGRGMGLAATMGIVNVHRGAIAVTSVEGQGSAFRVALPPWFEEQPGADLAPVSSSAWHGSGLVLLVDDEPAVRSASSGLLEQLGFQPLAANDGEHGLDLMRANADRIELVILDLTMPKLSGVEALSRMRELCPSTPVILTSAYHPAEMAELLRQPNVASFLPKPHTLATLEQALRAAWAERSP